MFNLLHKIEFNNLNELNKKSPTIGLLMMVKNEEKRLHVSLESVKNVASAIVIYDTGSTDNTVNICVEFAKKYKINLYLIQGVFEDFSTSRNVSLDFAETIDVKYLLLLDSNDELKGDSNLIKIAKNFETKSNIVFLVCQQWKSMDRNIEKLDKYYNTRFIKNKIGWRYKGSVHEYLVNPNKDEKNENDIFGRIADEEIIIYQDRTKDDDKSYKRFVRDRECLLKDYIKNPQDPRTVFYLGQTCQCLGLHDEALFYNRERTTMGNFEEEVYHAYYRCGLSAGALAHSWDDVMPWYMKAFQHSQRAEPFVKIAEYYKNVADAEMKAKKGSCTHNWKIAFMYIDMACKLEYPHSSILFVDKHVYDYQRWHLLGIIGFYSGELKRGKEGCMKAYENLKSPIDKNNIDRYLEVEKKIEEKKIEIENKIKEEMEKKKNIFINGAMNELTTKFPRTNHKNLFERANIMWENHNKKPI